MSSGVSRDVDRGRMRFTSVSAEATGVAGIAPGRGLEVNGGCKACWQPLG